MRESLYVQIAGTELRTTDISELLEVMPIALMVFALTILSSIKRLPPLVTRNPDG